MSSVAIGTDGRKGCAQFSCPAQAFCHYSLSQAASLMVGVGANRLKNGCPGDIVEPDRAKGDQFAIRGDRHKIEVPAVQGNTLDIPVPFPALISLIGLVRVESLPGYPTASRKLIFIPQGSNGVSCRGRDCWNRHIQITAAHVFCTIARPDISLVRCKPACW